MIPYISKSSLYLLFLFHRQSLNSFPFPVSFIVFYLPKSKIHLISSSHISHVNFSVPSIIRFLVLYSSIWNYLPFLLFSLPIKFLSPFPFSSFSVVLLHSEAVRLFYACLILSSLICMSSILCRVTSQNIPFIFKSFYLSQQYIPFLSIFIPHL